MSSITSYDRVFVGTTFTDHLALEPRLISMGLVAEGGEQFYVELADGWSTSECSRFTRWVVLPLLEDSAHRLPCAEAAGRLRSWIGRRPAPALLVSARPHRDAALLGDLFEAARVGCVWSEPARLGLSAPTAVQFDSICKTLLASGRFRFGHALGEALLLRTAFALLDEATSAADKPSRGCARLASTD